MVYEGKAKRSGPSRTLGEDRVACQAISIGRRLIERLMVMVRTLYYQKGMDYTQPGIAAY
jgi:hypothetical protein